MMRFRHLPTLACAALFVLPSPLNAATVRPVDIPERARGADRMVVGRVADIKTSIVRNEFGDVFIVSETVLTVEETLKGQPAALVVIDIPGGSYGGYTQKWSSLPDIRRGERAVFFLKKNANGRYEPHLRGQGILELDDHDLVKGSSLSLGMIRSMARQAQEQAQ
jgi:hypothetical protein